jgi:hypothetical protein
MVFGAEGVPGLTTEFIARETLSLVAPLKDPLVVGRSQVDLADILDLPMILPSRPHGVREEVEHAAMRVRRGLNVVMEIDALEQIKALVAEGAGYTVVSERVAGWRMALGTQGVGGGAKGHHGFVETVQMVGHFGAKAADRLGKALCAQAGFAGDGNQFAAIGDLVGGDAFQRLGGLDPGFCEGHDVLLGGCLNAIH